MAKSGVLTVRVIGDTKPFEGAMGTIGKTASVAFAAVAAAGVAGAAKSLGAFIGFERQMNEVFTLLPGISETAMDDMSAQVGGFAKEFGVLPDKVVPALYQALSAGVPQDNVFEFLETAQKAAKGGVTDLTTAVDGISSVVNAYGADVVDATKASDLMFTAVKLGKTNFEQLSASLSNVTPIASGLGVKFEDVSAALASMTAKGTPTAQATTQLRSLFVELSKAGGKTAETFEDMAGQTFQEFIAAGGNTAEALDIMAQAADESGVQLQDLFGSVEAGAAALSLATGDSFTNNIEAMGDSAGATDAAFQQMMTGLGPVIDKIKAFAAVVMIEVGQKLAPIVEEAMDRAGKAFAVLSDWWADHGPNIIAKAKEIGTAIKGFVDEAMPKVEAFALAVAGFVQGALATLKDWWETNGPLIRDAIDRIAVVLRDTLMVAFDALKSWWDTNGETITSSASTMSDGVGQAFQKIADAVEFVRDHWDKFKFVFAAGAVFLMVHWAAMAVAATVSAVTQVAAWVMTSTASMRHGAMIIFNILKVVAQWAFMGLQSLLHAGKVAAAWVIAMGPIGWAVAAVIAAVALIVLNWDKIKVAAGVVKDWIVEKWTAMVDFITELPARITKAAAGMWDGVKDAFKSAINWIIDKWNAFQIRLGGQRVNLPFGQGFTIPTITLDTPNIPRLETGGEVMKTGLAVVHRGERFSGTKNQHPLGGGGLTIHINAPNLVVGDKRAMEDMLLDALVSLQRRVGPLPVAVRG